MNSMSYHHLHFRARNLRGFRHQRGATLIVVVFLILIGLLALFTSSFSAASVQLGRDRVTNQALIQAKQALLAYATTRSLESSHPGELPCPDIDNDGDAKPPVEGSCGNPSGSTGQELRLGRLP